jgi:hypothetical protein
MTPVARSAITSNTTVVREAAGAVTWPKHWGAQSSVQVQEPASQPHVLGAQGGNGSTSYQVQAIPGEQSEFVEQLFRAGQEFGAHCSAYKQLPCAASVATPMSAVAATTAIHVCDRRKTE